MLCCCCAYIFLPASGKKNRPDKGLLLSCEMFNICNCLQIHCGSQQIFHKFVLVQHWTLHLFNSLPPVWAQSTGPNKEICCQFGVSRSAQKLEVAVISWVAPYLSGQVLMNLITLYSWFYSECEVDSVIISSQLYNWFYCKYEGIIFIMLLSLFLKQHTLRGCCFVHRLVIWIF